MKDTAVLLIIFNRPDTTQKVFEAIRKAKPKKLFVASDGPRPEKQGEKEKCEECRRIATNIDWDCDLHTLFRTENVGCGHGPSEAMNWFFSQVDNGIVLEDDCVPHYSFFRYCNQLLNYYKNDPSVMHIGGTNSQFGRKRGTGSYYFSKYPHIWGWATWKHAWEKFKYSFTKEDENKLKEIFEEYDFTNAEKEYWLKHWELVKNGERRDIWDIQWTFSCWLNQGKTIVPNVNLISNIGFNNEATHTKNEGSKLSQLRTEDIGVIKHPKNNSIDTKADRFTFENYNLLKVPLLNRLRHALSKFVPVIIKKKIKSIRNAQ